VLQILVECLINEPGPRKKFYGVTQYLWPQGDHHIPERYAPSDLLVRAR